MQTAKGSLTERFLESHAPKAESYSYIDPSLHKKYNTKRGLRNEDGTGVLIGLTEIGEVHGYVIDDMEKVPTEGRLFYRGLDVYDIVRGFQADQRFGFEEVSYLLLFGHLPTQSELEEYKEVLGTFRSLPDRFTEDMILNHASSDIMNKLARSVLALYSYDPNPEDLSLQNVLRQCIQLIGMFPCFVAYGYQAKRHYYHDESLYIHTPKTDLSTAENLLQMIRPDQKYTRLEAEVLDLCLVLHAEHGGGNNSAFSVHVVSSAATDTYSAIATGVGSLKGSKHGGASGKVASMMGDIKKNISDWEDEEEVSAYLRKILLGEAHDGSGLIYGIGHAVYTLSDPRAVLLKEKARELAMSKAHTPEFELYLTIERLAPRLFAEVKGSNKPLAPNVDFFSGFVYKLLNIPEDLYTPIFAVARIAGWAAHRIEELVSGGRIVRPAYKNVVPRQSYVGLEDR